MLKSELTKAYSSSNIKIDWMPIIVQILKVLVIFSEESVLFFIIIYFCCCAFLSSCLKLSVLDGCRQCAGHKYFSLSSQSAERATLVLTGSEWISELAELWWKETSKTKRILALCGASVNEISHHGSNSALHVSLSGYFYFLYSIVYIIVAWHIIQYY